MIVHIFCLFLGILLCVNSEIKINTMVLKNAYFSDFAKIMKIDMLKKIILNTFLHLYGHKKRFPAVFIKIIVKINFA